MKTLAAMSALAMLTVVIGGTAHGQTADYRTYFTFSAPVQLPGVTLPAGRYLFRLADPTTSRKVISVLSADGKTPLAILHTIPNQMAVAPREAEIRFMETPANVPPPIKTWWYPGKSIGYEFIYPRQQALQLAKVTSQPVLTTSAETKDFETADLARISGAGVPAPVVVEEAPAPVVVTGRAQRGDVAPAGTNAPVSAALDPRADERARSSARTQLPQTASRTPTLVFGGALTLLAGVALAIRRRGAA
jgi:LPXTG-motif cell wall-anchored protein